MGVLVAVTGENLDYKNVRYCNYDSKNSVEHCKEHCNTESAERKVETKMVVDGTQDQNLAVHASYSLEERSQEQ